MTGVLDNAKRNRYIGEENKEHYASHRLLLSRNSPQVAGDGSAKTESVPRRFFYLARVSRHLLLRNEKQAGLNIYKWCATCSDIQDMIAISSAVNMRRRTYLYVSDIDPYCITLVPAPRKPPIRRRATFYHYKRIMGSLVGWYNIFVIPLSVFRDVPRWRDITQPADIFVSAHFDEHTPAKVKEIRLYLLPSRRKRRSNR